MKNFKFLKQAICIVFAVVLAVSVIAPTFAVTISEGAVAYETSTDTETSTDAETATDAPETDSDAPETPEEPSEPEVPEEPSEPEEPGEPETPEEPGEPEVPETPEIPEEPGEPEIPEEPGEPETPTEPGEPEVPDEPETPTEPGEPENPEEPGDDEIVAKMTLYARTKIIPLFGHTWLYFENLSDKDIRVGAYTLAPGEGVSVGTFFYSRYDGIGTYYNIESYVQQEYGIRDAASISEYLTAEEMEKVSVKIANRNYWDPLTTCSGMPLTVWNSVSDNKVITLAHPLFVKIALLIKSSHEIGVPMLPVDREDVYKQKGFGESATLKEVSDLSVSGDF